MKPNSPEQAGHPAMTSLSFDIISGLSRPRKAISSKYLYDDEGSRLFEEICLLPEYHVTRTEMALLDRIVEPLAGSVPNGAALIEFGSGASVKTLRLLDAAPWIEAYVPIDISQAALEDAAARVSRLYPSLTVVPLVGDFTTEMALPEELVDRPRIGFFPGSTIGNFTPDQARTFLARSRQLLGDGAKFILGADATRDPVLLVPAYDDAAGVTAAFNLNLLTRINRDVGANFDPSQFRHRALWNEQEGRVEMHLVSQTRQEVRIGAASIVFEAGESIHTENSYKYASDHLRELASLAGWRVSAQWEGHDSSPFLTGHHRATFCTLLLEAA